MTVQHPMARPAPETIDLVDERCVHPRVGTSAHEHAGNSRNSAFMRFGQAYPCMDEPSMVWSCFVTSTSTEFRLGMTGFSPSPAERSGGDR